MRIVVWRSYNAPASHEWAAKICVPVRKDQKKSEEQGRDGPHAALAEHEEYGNGKPDKEELLPVVFYSETEDGAIARAQDAWDAKIALRDKKAADAMKRAALRAQRRPKAVA